MAAAAAAAAAAIEATAAIESAAAAVAAVGAAIAAVAAASQGGCGSRQCHSSYGSRQCCYGSCRNAIIAILATPKSQYATRPGLRHCPGALDAALSSPAWLYIAAVYSCTMDPAAAAGATSFFFFFFVHGRHAYAHPYAP